MKQRGYILLPLIIIVITIGFISYSINKNTQSKTPSLLTNPTTTDTPTPSIETENSNIRIDQDEKSYSDKEISFVFPGSWKGIDLERQYNSSDLVSFHLYRECNKRIGTFRYNSTNKTDPDSYKLAQKNTHGPAGQISKLISINDYQMGVQGDGSGGYEPKIVVDFLSQSRDLHFYFISVRGCRNSHEETYEKDILPIIKSVKLKA